MFSHSNIWLGCFWVMGKPWANTIYSKHMWCYLSDDPKNNNLTLNINVILLLICPLTKVFSTFLRFDL